MKKKKGLFDVLKRARRNFGEAFRGFVKQIKTAVVGGLLMWGIIELVRVMR